MSIYNRIQRKVASYFKGFPSAYIALRGCSYASLGTPENRVIRSDLLRSLSLQLHNVLDQGSLPVKLYIDKQGVYADVSGVLLSVELTDRYFKSPSGKNEAEDLVAVLDKFAITPTTILDIGANFGEISLYLAKNYPEASIFAIEASEENFTVLKKNISIQNFNVDKIVTINVALSDTEKELSFTKNLGSENSFVEYSPYATFEYTKVNAVPLRKIINDQNYKIYSVDFVKIDIEGSEPLLANDLAELSPRALYIEIGSKKYH